MVYTCCAQESLGSEVDTGRSLGMLGSQLPLLGKFQPDEGPCPKQNTGEQHLRDSFHKYAKHIPTYHSTLHTHMTSAQRRPCHIYILASGCFFVAYPCCQRRKHACLSYRRESVAFTPTTTVRNRHHLRIVAKRPETLTAAREWGQEKERNHMRKENSD